MVFNWFRRQYNDSPSSQPEQEDKSAQPPQPETTQTSTPDATADLLAFAKAAYKNIQEKQQPQPTETPTNDAVEVVEATADEPDPIDEDTQTAVAAIADEPDAEIEPEQVPESTEVSVIEETVTAPTTLSFLERAAAARQAKQERLNQNAIEVSEPEVAQLVTSTESTRIPEALDEGFLWSTSVIAGQGRRPEDVSIEEINWLKKLRKGLDKTRRNIVNQLKAIVGQGPLNADAVSEIESLLLQADVGVEATDYIITTLQNKLRQETLPPEEAIAYLKQILRDMLDEPVTRYKGTFVPEKENLNIWLITGVNGAGKTTTIGKIAHLAQKSGYKCLIGAADTFRAAAVEQVKIWGARSGVEVVANPGKNTDPAAVVFDAIAAATSRSTELLLVDTAGRLQNKKNLMDELSKIRRIINKKAPDAKVESLLVLDATLGQNGLRQAEVFSEAAQVSGVVLTKLDSTAKGGIALAVVRQLGLPIRFIGAGEGMEDLRPFSSYEFVEALLSG
ncbi:signal recognition particle-docking protein FtsY [Iningainema tapete]|uniref:Signal recognition particle receptor FtsY n=1 Tax=Iningainema tapete BLCC-T55 TaxID=2748662 RepID=A0A8J6XSQ2_9CYAN|nr:signal recognition particle-docking protein FtsY [Iningainema tapete]MBD2777649.1 signal recognition particle-docking protein FtsY [Iningainema tapete BLCC-T55]